MSYELNVERSSIGFDTFIVFIYENTLQLYVLYSHISSSRIPPSKKNTQPVLKELKEKGEERE